MTDTVCPRMPVRILTAMPTDLNPEGDVFGGWLMSHMDLAAGAICKRRAGGRVVTVAVEGFKFLAPVELGDEVVIYADIVKIGRSSITIKGLHLYSPWLHGCRDESMRSHLRVRAYWKRQAAQATSCQIIWASRERLLKELTAAVVNL